MLSPYDAELFKTLRKYETRTVRTLRGFESAEIVATAKRYRHTCGVYFLINLREIVYVGQSVNVPRRVEEHFNDPKMSFSHVAYLRVKEAHLDEVEQFYVRKFDPPYNRAYRNPDCHKMSHGSSPECSEHSQVVDFISAPGVTRTRGTEIRNLVLYPPELRGRGN
jgi:hypothetical protein